MRRLGKCDGCRQRKVKCDEKKPSCGGCQKGSRLCKYSYLQGQGFAIVLQDPNQMSRYGRSTETPVIHPLSSNHVNGEFLTPINATTANPEAPTLVPPDLHLRGMTLATDGRGIYQTLAPSRMKPTISSKKKEAVQRRRCHDHLLRLQNETTLSSHRPSAPDTRLTAMFIDMLRPESPRNRPLFTLGDWVTSIPARIGSNALVTMAAEFLLHSFDFCIQGSHSTRIQAMKTKSKALRELQLSLFASQQTPTYDLLLATKMHYASEVLLGVTNFHYAIHALGLMDLLKSGVVHGADEENFWNILDNTYIDDVATAMATGRPSIYDTEVYLSATHPTVLPLLALTNRQTVTRAIMHVAIQCPRLTVAIRHAIRNHGDVAAITAAISLAEDLWILAGQRHFEDYIDASIRRVSSPGDGTVAAILMYGIEFDVTQNMGIATRYWLLQNFLCGTLDTLHRRFPVEFAMSLLPKPEEFHAIDVSTAMQLGRVMLAFDRHLSPLTMIHAHSPFSGSIGAWHRQIRHLSSPCSDSDSSSAEQITRERELRTAIMMKRWVMDSCNVVLKGLHMTQVDEEAWMEAFECMAGEELVEWIPSKVSFAAEEGEMVMSLEYSDRASNGDSQPQGESRVFHVRNAAQCGPQHLRAWLRNSNTP